MYIRMDTEGLARFARDMRRAGRRDLNRELLKALRKRVKPMVPEIKAAILSGPSHAAPVLTPSGRRSRRRGTATRSAASRERRVRGLRDAEARGVQVKASLSAGFAGVSLRIDPRHFPDGQKALPMYREGVKRPWRSPNWGRDDWKTQAAHPAFYPTIERRLPQISAELIAEISEFVERATREGSL